jgi:hypothetical protein
MKSGQFIFLKNQIKLNSNADEQDQIVSDAATSTKILVY